MIFGCKKEVIIYIKGGIDIKNFKIKFLISIAIYSFGFILGLITIVKFGDFSAIPKTDKIVFSPERFGLVFTVTLLMKNLLIIAILMSGLFCFSITTIITLLINGFYLGCILTTKNLSGVSIESLAIVIIPHGIFEITGLFIAACIGFSGVRLHFNKRKEWEVMKVYALISCILIYFAAIIEGNFTPLLIK